MKVVKATLDNLKEIAPLFDRYRVFYKQESDQDAAFNFLKERFTKNESVIFFAKENNNVLGFAQLYFSFSSVSLQASLVLNDLYVDTPYRKKGVGEALLNEAKKFCISENQKGLALETAIDNPAQKLYEKLGWEKDTHCYHYFWSAK